MSVHSEHLNAPWLGQTLLSQVHSHSLSNVAVDLDEAVHGSVTHLQDEQRDIMNI